MSPALHKNMISNLKTKDFESGQWFLDFVSKRGFQVLELMFGSYEPVSMCSQICYLKKWRFLF